MPNPFVYGGRVAPQAFVGREAELREILGKLNVTHRGQIQHVSVVGPRRIGKSSLLYYLSHTAKDRLPNPHTYRFAYLDLQDPHFHTLSGFLRHVLQVFELPIPAALTLETFYETFEAAQRNDHLWRVLLLDEFEELFERQGEFTDAFYDTLRSLANNSMAGFVCASQSSLADLKRQGKLTSPFFNIFYRCDLGEFTPAETQALLMRGRTSDQAFTEAECAKIIEIAGNHPARLQLTAGLLYEAKATGKPVDWKALKARLMKEAPFVDKAEHAQKTKGRLLNALLWLVWDLPQYIGHFIMVIIGRGEHTNPTTDRLFGYVVYVLALALLLGFLPWSLFTKYLTRLSELFFK